MKEPGILDQFKGFLETKDIHEYIEGSEFPVFQMPEVELDNELRKDLENLDHPRNSVLGKRMESFFELAIKHSGRYNMIASNIQIINNKTTLGELDFLLHDLQRDLPLHVELVYKLYVYDPEMDNEEDKWIGPNRRDSFSEKLTKLRAKQFPLLYKNESLDYIKEYGLDPKRIEQQLCFKARLFLPADQDLIFNKDYITGNWLRLVDFEKMDDKQNLFFCPKKKFWSCDPSVNPNWMPYSEAIKDIHFLFRKKKSPLVWMKTKTSYLSFFLVWW